MTISPIARTLNAASSAIIIDEKRELDLRREEIKADKNPNVEYAEENIKILINESIRKVPDLMELVKESQSARMYEAAGSFIKVISDLNKDLVGLSKTTEPTKFTSPKEGEKPGDTNIFLGTTEDFLSRIQASRGETYEAEK